jgi:uncharacterized protein YaiL (DUF2058 family)
MADSLRDQLLALGLAKKPEPRPQGKDERRGPKGPGRPAPAAGKGAPGKPAPRAAAAPREPDLAQAYAARARSEREERERAERDAQARAREKRERRAKLAALLEGKALNVADADIARHFDHGGKIRRVYVTADQLPRVNAGELGVVQRDGRYLVVAREVALAAREIVPECIALLADPDAPAEDDVPPDLVW